MTSDLQSTRLDMQSNSVKCTSPALAASAGRPTSGDENAPPIGTGMELLVGVTGGVA